MFEAIQIRRTIAGRHLLDDVSLSIQNRERLAIVGPTGSGKTLLLRALAWLDPLEHGEIRWQGTTVQGNSVPAFRSQVMYLHQRPALMETTVEESLRRPFTLRSQQHRSFSRDRILELLKQVHHDATFLERSTRDLSGGEAQIVALLRAIQLEPTLLLLDEPTAALDDASTRSIEQLVLGWHDAPHADRALVWVSHNSQQVARIANQVAYMRDGRLTEQPGAADDPAEQP
ncbi:MAG: ATP-binding cassette domain-containing protein [Planctomycetota bacterium]|nr:ATP-binding cassette domain-containing protein [Planctomycetota bacterium]